MADDRVFDVSGVMLQQVAQSLLEGKKMARAIENMADSFQPLTDKESVVHDLNIIAEKAREISLAFARLYNPIAREAAQQP